MVLKITINIPVVVFMKADNGVKNNNQYSSRCVYES